MATFTSTDGSPLSLEAATAANGYEEKSLMATQILVGPDAHTAPMELVAEAMEYLADDTNRQQERKARSHGFGRAAAAGDRLFGLAWDPNAHPRDEHGKFIDTPDVQLPGGGRGKAIEQHGNTITVEKADGTRENVVASEVRDVSKPGTDKPAPSKGKAGTAEGTAAALTELRDAGGNPSNRAYRVTPEGADALGEALGKNHEVPRRVVGADDNHPAPADLEKFTAAWKRGHESSNAAQAAKPTDQVTAEREAAQRAKDDDFARQTLQDQGKTPEEIDAERQAQDAEAAQVRADASKPTTSKSTPVGEAGTRLRAAKADVGRQGKAEITSAEQGLARVAKFGPSTDDGDEAGALRRLASRLRGGTGGLSGAAGLRAKADRAEQMFGSDGTTRQKNEIRDARADADRLDALAAEIEALATTEAPAADAPEADKPAPSAGKPSKVTVKGESMTLTPKGENEWDVTDADGERIGTLEKVREARQKQPSGGSPISPGVNAERDYWYARNTARQNAGTSDGFSSRAAALEALRDSHAKSKLPLNEGQLAVLRDHEEQGFSRRHGATAIANPILLQRGLIRRRTTAERNESDQDRVFEVTDAGRAALAAPAPDKPEEPTRKQPSSPGSTNDNDTRSALDRAVADGNTGEALRNVDGDPLVPVSRIRKGDVIADGREVESVNNVQGHVKFTDGTEIKPGPTFKLAVREPSEPDPRLDELTRVPLDGSGAQFGDRDKPIVGDGPMDPNKSLTDMTDDELGAMAEAAWESQDRDVLTAINAERHRRATADPAPNTPETPAEPASLAPLRDAGWEFTKGEDGNYTASREGVNVTVKPDGSMDYNTDDGTIRGSGSADPDRLDNALMSMRRNAADRKKREDEAGRQTSPANADAERADIVRNAGFAADDLRDSTERRDVIAAIVNEADDPDLEDQLNGALDALADAVVNGDEATIRARHKDAIEILDRTEADLGGSWPASENLRDGIMANAEAGYRRTDRGITPDAPDVTPTAPALPDRLSGATARGWASSDNGDGTISLTRDGVTVKYDTATGMLSGDTEKVPGREIAVGDTIMDTNIGPVKVTSITPQAASGHLVLHTESGDRRIGAAGSVERVKGAALVAPPTPVPPNVASDLQGSRVQVRVRDAAGRESTVTGKLEEVQANGTIVIRGDNSGALVSVPLSRQASSVQPADDLAERFPEGTRVRAQNPGGMAVEGTLVGYDENGFARIEWTPGGGNGGSTLGFGGPKIGTFNPKGMTAVDGTEPDKAPEPPTPSNPNPPAPKAPRKGTPRADSTGDGALAQAQIPTVADLMGNGLDEDAAKAEWKRLYHNARFRIRRERIKNEKAQAKVQVLDPVEKPTTTLRAELATERRNGADVVLAELESGKGLESVDAAVDALRNANPALRDPAPDGRLADAVIPTLGPLVAGLAANPAKVAELNQRAKRNRDYANDPTAHLSPEDRQEWLDEADAIESLAKGDVEGARTYLNRIQATAAAQAYDDAAAGIMDAQVMPELGDTSEADAIRRTIASVRDADRNRANMEALIEGLRTGNVPGLRKFRVGDRVSLPPKREPVPADASFEDRAKALAERIPKGRAGFRNAGHEFSGGSQRDTAPDGGPTAQVMEHLDAIKVLGETVDLEASSALSRILAERGIDPDKINADVEAIKAEKEALWDSIQASKRGLGSQGQRNISQRATTDVIENSEWAKRNGFEPTPEADRGRTVSRAYAAFSRRTGELRAKVITPGGLTPEEAAEATELRELQSQSQLAGMQAVSDAIYGYNAKIKAWNAAKERVFDAQRAYRTAQSDAYMETLRRLRPMGPSGDAKLSLTGNTVGGKVVDQASSYYPTEWVAHAGSVPLEVKRGTKRGHYQAGNFRSSAAIALSPSGGKTVEGDSKGNLAVAIHELGHHMEKMVPGLADAEWAFLWQRTSKGEPGARTRERPRMMDGMRGEYSYHDDFKTAYSGKEYSGHSDSFELFTTAVEEMFGGRGDYLDDDFRRWVLGTLAAL